MESFSGSQATLKNFHPFSKTQTNNAQGGQQVTASPIRTRGRFIPFINGDGRNSCSYNATCRCLSHLGVQSRLRQLTARHASSEPAAAAGVYTSLLDTLQGMEIWAGGDPIDTSVFQASLAILQESSGLPHSFTPGDHADPSDVMYTVFKALDDLTDGGESQWATDFCALTSKAVCSNPSCTCVHANLETERFGRVQACDVRALGFAAAIKQASRVEKTCGCCGKLTPMDLLRVSTPELLMIEVVWSNPRSDDLKGFFHRLPVSFE